MRVIPKGSASCVTHLASCKVSASGKAAGASGKAGRRAQAARRGRRAQAARQQAQAARQRAQAARQRAQAARRRVQAARRLLERLESSIPAGLDSEWPGGAIVIKSLAVGTSRRLDWWIDAVVTRSTHGGVDYTLLLPLYLFLCLFLWSAGWAGWLVGWLVGKRGLRAAGWMLRSWRPCCCSLTCSTP